MRDEPTEAEKLDVLIVGAGISGIDAAYHLCKHHPQRTFAILEGQEDIGGTWRTHRFPGIRSDSDLFTFGYSWKPWHGTPIATAEEILRYLNEAVDEQDLRGHLRTGCRVISADWSGQRQSWLVRYEAEEGPATIECNFIWMCAGYYDHARPFMPDWPGTEAFKGRLVHPQTWPEDLAWRGKRIAVIGSGATAATLVPAIAEEAAQVTMIQRSPTYYYPRPSVDEFQQILAGLGLPEDQYHDLMRRKYLRDSEITARRAREEPEALAADFKAGVDAHLGEGHGLEAHFQPDYLPWRQRVALVPDGDLFAALKSGKAEIVTDQIETFTPEGLRLASGREIAADVIVSATGLRLSMFGEIALTVDERPVEISEHVTHRSLMFSDLPNFAAVFGYLRSSWTLRADLVSSYLCRLLSHLDAHGMRSVTPRLQAEDTSMPLRPWIDPENFNPGYIMRGLHLMPRQGDRQPWLMTQDFYQDREELPLADLEDGTLVYA